jgi:hypothetical protein
MKQIVKEAVETLGQTCSTISEQVDPASYVIGYMDGKAKAEYKVTYPTHNYRNEVSQLAKKLNRTRKRATEYMTATRNRKIQTDRWNRFFHVLLEQGMITKEELREYSPRKPKSI